MPVVGQVLGVEMLRVNLLRPLLDGACRLRVFLPAKVNVVGSTKNGAWELRGGLRCTAVPKGSASLGRCITTSIVFLDISIPRCEVEKDFAGSSTIGQESRERFQAGGPADR